MQTPRREINLIVIHCSATPNGKSLAVRDDAGNIIKTDAQVIDEWHGARKPPFQRRPDWIERFNPHLRHVGYHYVIETGGGLFTGRHPHERGAHVAGYNRRSLGVCLIGGDAFTAPAWSALRELILALLATYPRARVMGHRDFSPDADGDGTVEPHEWLKTCPGFDVTHWWLRANMQPMPGHIYGGAT